MHPERPVDTPPSAAPPGPEDHHGAVSTPTGGCQDVGVSSPNRRPLGVLRPFRRAFARVEAAQVQRFGRSVVSVAARVDALVLHSVGRTTGTERRTVLAFAADADTMLVVGGARGQHQIPDWVTNLRTTPEAAVTVGRRRSDVVATELDDEEHDRIWADLVQVWPRIATYHRRAGRRIPVFRLIPTDRESARRPQGM